MSVTRDTSHFDMSLLKDAAPRNMALISVTLDTSHFPIAPYGPSEQSPSEDTSTRQMVMALLSSAMDFGENKNSPAQKFGEIEMRRAKKTT